MENLYSFRVVKPFADNRAITSYELSKVLKFVNNGDLIGSSKKSGTQLKEELYSIGYKEEKHFEYNYFYHWGNKSYAPDARHVYIKELKKYISFL